MDKKLFLDYDECMAHSFYANNEAHANELIDTYGEHFRGEKFKIRHDGWYVTFKRNWTDKLLLFSRQLLGNDNVFILTTSTGDYIRNCNIVLELGFDPNTNIFSRDEMFIQNTHPKFKNTFNVLVDNMNYNDHLHGMVSKIEFLNRLPEEQYIKVVPFEVWTAPISDDGDYFNELTDRIITALNF
jgi:hypothetical protein